MERRLTLAPWSPRLAPSSPALVPRASPLAPGRRVLAPYFSVVPSTCVSTVSASAQSPLKSAVGAALRYRGVPLHRYRAGSRVESDRTICPREQAVPQLLLHGSCPQVDRGATAARISRLLSAMLPQMTVRHGDRGFVGADAAFRPARFGADCATDSSLGCSPRGAWGGGRSRCLCHPRRRSARARAADSSLRQTAAPCHAVRFQHHCGRCSRRGGRPR